VGYFSTELEAHQAYTLAIGRGTIDLEVNRDKI